MNARASVVEPAGPGTAESATTAAFELTSAYDAPTGLVLPISNPLPLSTGSGFDPATGATYQLGAVPPAPIPVPLPPGLAMGAIGLVAAGIARYRWNARRA